MRILALDTSGPVCSTAVYADGKILFECAVQNKLTHSVNLMQMVDQALTASGIAAEDVDRLAIVTGPGSFTGVRIGVSTVKGLSHGLNAPCVEVDALEAMAYSAGCFDGIICPIQDARAGQVYCAAFTGDEKHLRLMDDIPLKLTDFLEQVRTMGKRFLFTGDGMPVHREAIEKILGEQAVMAPSHLCYLRAAAVAFLAAGAEETKDYHQLQPMYLRAPSAERNKKLMEANAHE